MHSEHPSGKEYATYLSALAKTKMLNVRCSTEVSAINDISPGTKPLRNKDFYSADGEEVDDNDNRLTLFSVDIVEHNNDDPLALPMTETLTSRYVIWAAGEFQYPNKKSATDTKRDGNVEEEKKSDDGSEMRIDNDDDDGSTKENDELPGSELCRHNSTVKSWKKLDGNDFVVIGGYESGVDACVNLAQVGKR